MKTSSFEAAVISLILIARASFSAEPAPPTPAGNASTNAVGPKIQFASTVYDFGKVIAGEQVRHDFIFTNTGDALLEISGVYPSCGCTTAGNWSRQVEPGKTGVIPLQFNSGRFGAQAIAKTTAVACNDKNQPSVTLQIKGTLWKPIDVNPQTVVLNFIPGSPSNAPATVNIVSSLEEPITLSEPKSSNPAFAVELATVQPGKQFQLIVRAVPPLAQGNVQGTITLKTSSTNFPTVDVSALAIVQPALVVMPPQIMLPPGPLHGPYPSTISIRNNLPSPLTLSQPALNVDGVQFQITEVQPGYQFTVATTFPAGFQIPQGQEAALSIKTSQAQSPVIVIPVRHAVPPARLQPPSPPGVGPLPPPSAPAPAAATNH